MRKRPLTVAALAVLALSGGLVACDEPRVDALHAKCTTKDLKWQVTVLKKKPRSTHREGRLSAVNTGSGKCVFGGYPAFRVFLGKGPFANGVGQGRTRPVGLPRGGSVVIDFQYRDPAGERPALDDCFTNGHAVAAAPRDTGRDAMAPIQDEKGRETGMDVCGDVIRMAPPRETSG
ncbi:DUF4232 domain-containing protein [Streptomyces monomycini]|uniref:DUF4232 domain-containing protein n=1 Tax=Streptomyces monomycini TaxID=371720 RepID=UPI000AB659E0|nr:DUF4232 domain-containing protein [Streptomyces monomycini]